MFISNGIKITVYCRYTKAFTYGLSEVMNISHCNRFIANPGCYATATELALYPLISNHLIRVDSIIVDAKSGLTGAGKN